MISIEDCGSGHVESSPGSIHDTSLITGNHAAVKLHNRRMIVNCDIPIVDICSGGHGDFTGSIVQDCRSFLCSSTGESSAHSHGSGRGMNRRKITLDVGNTSGQFQCSRIYNSRGSCIICSNTAIADRQGSGIVYRARTSGSGY